MAKLKAPLLSLGASQQLGKALVFFSWKGLDVVREYVIPANPKSTAQMLQRGYVTAAVAKIHEAQGLAALPLNEDDKTAYSLLASTYPTPSTWFNMIVKLWLDCKVAGDRPIVYRAGDCPDKDHLDARPFVYIEEEVANQLAAGKFYLGTSRTALVKTKAATIIAGSQAWLPDTFGFDDLTAKVKYYWQFRPDSTDPCVGADSGIYHFTAT